MDQKTIGEYLKRLRIRSKYTQTDVGSFIKVTDKAISRWENGAGMPEISNLMVLAKLYGVTVDDILNCNEAVFELSSLTEETVDENTDEIADPSCSQLVQAPAEQNSSIVQSVSSETSEEERATVKAKIISKPSGKFCVVLLFSYLMFGTFLSANISIYQEAYVTAFCILFTVLALSVAVINFIAKWLPVKVCFIVNVVLYALLAVCSLLIIPFLLVISYYEKGIGMVASAFGVFVLLFIMQILYVIYDFCKNEKTKKALNFCALGVASSALALAICVGLAFGVDLRNGSLDFVILLAIFAAITAISFSFAQIFSKWINIISAIAIVPCALICITYRFFSFEISLNETIVDTSIWIFDMNFALGISIIAILAIIIGWFFEGHKLSLAATRIVSVIAVAVMIPLLVMTIDSFAVNVMFGSVERSASVFLKITVIIAAIIYCAKLYRFDLFFKSFSKGGKEY